MSSDDAGIADGSSGDGGEVDSAESDAADASGTDDADGTPDPGDSDAGETEPEPPDSPFCDTCTQHEECGGEADLCLTNNQTQERFCAVDCSDTDDLCPPGGVCQQIADGVRQCVPPGATCAGYEPVSLKQQRCGESALCYGEFGTCVSNGGVGYCSSDCESDTDCGTGTSRCSALAGGAKVCRADWELGPEGCGWGERNAAGVGGRCDSDAECPGSVCVASGLPSTVSPFCSLACSTDSDCGVGARCGEIGLGLGLGSVCVPEPCSCLHTVAPDSLLHAALTAGEIHPCEAIYLKDRFAYLGSFARFDPARLKHFDRVHSQPLRTGEWVDDLTASTDAALATATPVADAIAEAAIRVDRPTAAPLEPATSGGGGDALVGAVAAFLQAVGDPVDEAALTAALDSVPNSVREPVAAVLLAMSRVPEVRATALGPFDSSSDLDLLFSTAGMLLYESSLQFINLAAPEILGYLVGGDSEFPEFGYNAMYGAARDVAAAVESQSWPSGGAGEGFHVVIETSAGAIVLSDDESRTYNSDTITTESGIALLVDTGGDDTYRIPVAANHTVSNSVSIAIDLGGDDVYGYEGDEDTEAAAPLLPDDGSGRYSPNPNGPPFGPFSYSITSRQGGANLGVALHFDFGDGNDQYRSLRRSQGFASLGVGALYDAGGNDSYSCEAGCQGSGIFGIGVQIDAGEGSDDWRSWAYSQGFAYLRAYGLLADGGGDDTYTCVIGTGEEGDVMVYYSPQRPDVGNNSMCQGFGFGRRADTGDGISLSGGLGILRDVGGHDSYFADVFNQGGGYWFGTGVLADESGDDTYFGRYYTQAIGAHFAMGFLVDESGNDTHNDGQNPASSIGFAHDASTTLLRDSGGDDLWQGAGMRGFDGGMSLVIEASGTDTYLNCTLGRATLGPYANLDPEMLALGVFLDGGGTDDYETSTPDGVSVENDNAWSWKVSEEILPGEHGMGADGTAPLGL